MKRTNPLQAILDQLDLKTLDDPTHRAPLYLTEEGPHETNGLTRAFRAGWNVPQIVKLARLRSGNQVKRALTDAMSDEQDAHSMGRPIHDDSIDPKLAK